MVNNSAIAFIVVLGQKVVLFTALSNLSDEIGLGGCLWSFVLILLNQRSAAQYLV